MAGIGFELKKIFKERSVVNLLKGAFYSTFTVIGPMLITIVGFMLLFIVMGYQYIDYESRDLLISIVLYIFIFSLILTSPLSAIISRYIADKFFEEDLGGVMPCYYAGLLINVILGVICCVPFLVITVNTGDVDPLLMMMAGCMFMALLFVFYNMTFLSALKEYKTIVLTFLFGMSLALLLSYFFYQVLLLSFLFSILTSMTIGFMFIGFIIFSLIKKFFKINNNNYMDFLSYLWRYKLLFLTNLCYILGLYVHNFVYWNFEPLAIVVKTTFHSAPVYDTATFLAMMTNVSATVIFTVRVEINFHKHYQVYCQQLLGGTGKDINIAKSNMFHTLAKEILYIVQIQTSISIIIFLLLMIFASFFGFGGMVMTIYPALAAGYFVIYIMYCMIVFLYYYDDRIGAFVSSLVFFVATFAAAILSTYLKPGFYGISPFIGAFFGWTVAFFRLKYIEHNIDRLMFCKGKLVNKVYKKKQGTENLITISRK